MLAAAALSAAALPSAASAAGLNLIDESEQIGPGISVHHVKTLESGGWFDYQLLTARLENGLVTTDLLSGDAVTDAGPISRKANRVSAVAGVNGDFFDIDNTRAPQNVAIRGGELLKSANWGLNAPLTGVTRDGIGQLVSTALEAKVTFGGADHAVATINTPGGVPAGAFRVYTSKWGAAISRAGGNPSQRRRGADHRRQGRRRQRGRGHGGDPGRFLLPRRPRRRRRRRPRAQSGRRRQRSTTRSAATSPSSSSSPSAATRC